MSTEVDQLAVAAAKRWVLPWLGSVAVPWILLVLVMAAAGIGGVSMYLGYEIAAGRHARDMAQVKESQIQALKIRTDQYLGAVDRGNEIADKFERALSNIRIENKTFKTEILKETQQQVYIDCKVPESGTELLRKRIEAANARIKQGVLEPEPVEIPR